MERGRERRSAGGGMKWCHTELGFNNIERKIVWRRRNDKEKMKTMAAPKSMDKMRREHKHTLKSQEPGVVAIG